MAEIADETEYDASAHSQDSNATAFARLIDAYREGDAPSAWVLTALEKQQQALIEHLRAELTVALAVPTPLTQPRKGFWRR